MIRRRRRRRRRSRCECQIDSKGDSLLPQRLRWLLFHNWNNKYEQKCM